MNDDYEIVKFGNLKEGDKLVGSNNELVEVNKVYQKHIPHKMFEIEMEDGAVIKASGNHLWYCETDTDLNGREEYLKLAQEFFKNNEIPQEVDGNPYYSLYEMVNIFGDNIKTQLFIERACRSLGYSSFTPHIILEDLKKTSNEIIYNYDYNDLIKFLQIMKESVLNDKGYFYYGEVRTTEEIAELIINHNINVNIPHKSEM